MVLLFTSDTDRCLCSVIVPVGQPAQATVLTKPFSSTVSVAIIWRLQGASTYMKLSFSFASGFTLTSVISGGAIVLGTWNNASLLSAYIPGQSWVSISGVHDGGTNVRAFFQGINVLNGTDYSNVLNWGSIGLWSDGQALFSNLSLVSTCAGGGLDCSGLAETQSCTYGCKPGYYAVTSSNSTISCPVGAAALIGNMYCFSKPPT